jgi:hypothetical protein
MCLFFSAHPRGKKYFKFVKRSDNCGFEIKLDRTFFSLFPKHLKQTLSRGKADQGKKHI